MFLFATNNQLLDLKYSCLGDSKYAAHTDANKVHCEVIQFWNTIFADSLHKKVEIVKAFCKRKNILKIFTNPKRQMFIVF